MIDSFNQMLTPIMKAMVDRIGNIQDENEGNLLKVHVVWIKIRRKCQNLNQEGFAQRYLRPQPSLNEGGVSVRGGDLGCCSHARWAG